MSAFFRAFIRASFTIAAKDLRSEMRTKEAFNGGWFHTGDLGVMHPDGYVELRDRAKDVVISGGENISTVEVEQAGANPCWHSGHWASLEGT